MARCRSSATPLMCRPRLGRRRERLEIASGAEESARAGQHHDLRRGGVAERGGIGQLASHDVVHAVCGIGPVQGDSRDRAGLLERDGLVFGHTWTLSATVGRLFTRVWHAGLSRALTTKVEMAASRPKTSRHTEVERKFDVVESTVSPSFEGLSAVARVERSPSQHLEAVYFDTPGHDLAAHHVTLRRRTGGSDAGWHLKLPAGPDTRTEVRAPLDDGADGGRCPTICGTSCWRSSATGRWRRWPASPPTAPSTLLYGADGAAIAEFSDDKVTACGRVEGDEQQWREWELELVEGASDVARPAGPAGQPPARRRRGACRARVETRPGAGGAAGDDERADRSRRGRSDPPGRRRTGRPAGRVGPRGAGRRLRLGAPDAGHHAQDPQPAAGVRGRVRHLRRRVDPRRAAPARQRAGRRARRRGAGRALRTRPGRPARRPGPWSDPRSGWSTAPSGATSPACGGR